MPKALIDSNGVVVNIIEYAPSGDYQPPAGLTMVDVGEGCAIGGTYNASTSTFTPPTPPAPASQPPTADQFAALQSAVATLTMQVLTGGA